MPDDVSVLFRHPFEAAAIIESTSYQQYRKNPKLPTYVEGLVPHVLLFCTEHRRE